MKLPKSRAAKYKSLLEESVSQDGANQSRKELDKRHIRVETILWFDDFVALYANSLMSSMKTWVSDSWAWKML